MKKLNGFYFFLIIVFMILTSVKAWSLDYFITFTGSGVSTNVDNVIATNLTKGTQVTVPAGFVLHLSDVTTNVPLQNTIVDFANLYPNPMNGITTFSFLAKKDGKAQITVYGLEGRKITGSSYDLLQGKNSFHLDLPRGVYTLRVDGVGYSYTIKAISMSDLQAKPQLTFEGNANEIMPVKISNNQTFMSYSSGDVMQYEGNSELEDGTSGTMVIDVPEGSKTTNFYFVKCKDGEKNTYKVVRIGNQIWMAENLKTTKYRNGDLIGTTNTVTQNICSENKPKYQWAYNGEEGNVLTFGRLYNWFAAVDPRGIAPEGWHVPTDAEWTELENYLIANGYNYDGSTSGNYYAKSMAAAGSIWATTTNPGAIGNNRSANNRSGFSALPAGERGTEGNFHDLGYFASWWSSSKYCPDGGDLECYISRNTYWSNYGVNRSIGDYCRGLSVRCVMDIPGTSLPQTYAQMKYNNTSLAFFEGKITYNGGGTIIGSGVCWNTTGNPTTADEKTSEGTFSTFKSKVTGLNVNTTYYLRAYATNSFGTGYSNEDIVFTTTSDPNTVFDIDGNSYHTITLGTQTWMTENLRTSKFRNGESINNLTNGNSWWNATTAAWCDYENDELKGYIFGHLYNWHTVSDSRNIAPEGWHVPSAAEWDILLNYLIANGYNYDGTTSGNKVGKSMASKTYWEQSWTTGAVGYEKETNNSSGFTGLPAGRRKNSGSFYSINTQTIWWSRTQYDATNAWYRLLDQRNVDLLSDNYFTKEYGFSIRCVKD